MTLNPERDRAIAFIVEGIARELLEKFGVTGPPVPVRHMVGHLPPPWRQIQLVRVPILPWEAMHTGNDPHSDVILLRQGLTAAQERVAIAQQMFHLFLMRLNAREIWAGPLDFPGVWANHFGRHLLLPTKWLGGGGSGKARPAAVARLFDVPEALAVQRLRELGLDTVSSIY